MATFLKTSGVTFHLENIIQRASSKLWLISPYLKFNNQIKQFINGSNLTEIKIVYGKKDKLKESDHAWIMSNPKLSLYYLDNLHAKCYLNEIDAIVTSLNLYEYSQVNNIKMGLLINTSNDPDTYNDILIEAERIIRMAECIKSINPKSENIYKNRIKQQVKSAIHYGYCIRTGIEISFNPERALSSKAYNSWAQFEDYNYLEKYCHFTGESSNGETSFGKPILRKNWKAAQILSI